MPSGCSEKILVEPNAVLSLASTLTVTAVCSAVATDSSTACGGGNCTTIGGSTWPLSSLAVSTACCCTTGVTSSFGTNASTILAVVPSGLVTVTILAGSG